jgi:signal transduction histidine kinase
MEQTYERSQHIDGSKENFITGIHEVAGNVSQAQRLIGRSYSEREWSEQGSQKDESFASLKKKAAVFTHELANSLTAISYSLQFIETELQTKRVNNHALTAVIQAAVGELYRLDSMLVEFRSPASWRNCELISTDLATVVKEVLALELSVCRTGGIDVKAEFENALPLVKLDAAKMKQVVLNLCKNAVEAMPKGGCLTLRVYQSERLVVLEISDDGVGLPEGLNAFELFKTTKPRGSGIGLSVVQEIVSAHNATITGSNDAGGGTTFRIVFPTAN